MVAKKKKMEKTKMKIPKRNRTNPTVFQVFWVLLKLSTLLHERLFQAHSVPLAPKKMESPKSTTVIKIGNKGTQKKNTLIKNVPNFTRNIHQHPLKKPHIQERENAPQLHFERSGTSDIVTDCPAALATFCAGATSSTVPIGYELRGIL